VKPPNGKPILNSLAVTPDEVSQVLGKTVGSTLSKEISLLILESLMLSLENLVYISQLLQHFLLLLC
jgi:hypothetical protein